jgi:hypothetical protein
MFIQITSGSFGEGLEMKGSDVDMMVVFSNVTDTKTKTYFVM